MTSKRAVVDSESFKKLQETKDSLRQVESFPYSEDLRSVMDTSVFTARPEMKVRAVVKDMAARSVSSVIVVDDTERPIGIVTERDIMGRIVAKDGFDIDNSTISSVMTPDPVTLNPSDTIYRSLSLLSASGVKHLPLVEDGRVAGIVTLRRILKLRYPEPMSLIEGIRGASEIATLRAIKSKLPLMVESRLKAGRRAHDIVVMISLINQDLHNKVLELVLEKCGQPPVPFCLYVTGSHGRLENLLSPDQDHGMIIADSDDDEAPYDPYYMEFSSTFSQWLDEVGFETCPGYIMCSNPLWRKDVSEWKLQIQYWFDKQVRELGRFCTVLFDARPIFGEYKLFEQVRNFAFSLLGMHHEVLRVLHEEEGRHRVPTGLLGRFITEKSGEHRGELDIKRSGLIFMVEAIRILALFHGIKETATIKRIQSLVAGGQLHRDDGESFEIAYLFLLELALKTQVEKMIQGHNDTFVNPKHLSQHERETLRHAFKAVSSLQDLVAGQFGELIL